MSSVTLSALTLRDAADVAAGSLPPLLAAAEHLAASIVAGAHGRRRAGRGEEFWQYRQAIPGDTAPSIDWRRSGRGDIPYVRQMEWSASQHVVFWVDGATSMEFASTSATTTKSNRAKVIALALARLLGDAGERMSLLGRGPQRPGSGRTYLMQFAQTLATAQQDATEYGAPPAAIQWPAHGWAVFLSDFLGDIAPVRRAMAEAAGQGVRGVCLQILDPVEERFPFSGRTDFRSVGGGVRFETKKASALEADYKAKLLAQRAALQDAARATGWYVSTHHTDQSAQPALLWAYSILSGGARV